jgi:hypothetical protein
MEPTQYKVVVFRNDEIPDYYDVKNPGPAVQRLAQDKFGFNADDFDPGKRIYGGGIGRHGYQFEVQVTAAAAAALEARNHPDVLRIFDPLPPHDFHTGARDPKELRKKSGPKFP